MNPKLKQYYIMVDFLEQLLGPDYEIVLHDMSLNNGEIVKIANGNITGRRVGGALTDGGKKSIAEGIYKDIEFHSNFHTRNKFGKLLRSCALFIKDENNNLDGILVVNFDDSKFINIVEQLLKLIHSETFIEERKSIENDGDETITVINDSIQDIINYTINDVLEHDTSINLAHEMSAVRDNLITFMSTQTRYNIIKELDEKGIFQIKGSVQEAAKLLNCSTPSIYRYLTMIKEDNNE